MDAFFTMIHDVLGGVVEDLLFYTFIGVLASLFTLALFAIWYGRDGR